MHDADPSVAFDAADDLVRRAQNLAVAAHGDRRSWSGRRQIDHVAAVAATVSSLDLGPAFEAAACLHDVVEDTDETLAGIRSAFPALVADLVCYMTDVYDPKLFPTWPRRIRKPAEALRLGSPPDPLWQVLKLADLASNTDDLGDPSTLWLARQFVPVYLQEADYQLACLWACSRLGRDSVVELWERTRSRVYDVAARVGVDLERHALRPNRGGPPVHLPGNLRWELVHELQAEALRRGLVDR